MITKFKYLLYTALLVVIAMIGIQFTDAIATTMLAANNNQTVYQVQSWSGAKSKQAIIVTLKKVAKANHASLALVHSYQDDSKTSYTVYQIAGTNGLTAYGKSQKISFQTTTQALGDAITGSYYIEGSKTAKTNIINQLNQLGLTGIVLPSKMFSSLVANTLNETMVMIIIGLLSLVFVVSVFEKLSRAKDYAVIQLNGISGIRLQCYDMTRAIKSIISGGAAFVLIAFLGSWLRYSAIGVRLFSVFFLLMLGIMLIVLLFFNYLSYGALNFFDLAATLKDAKPTQGIVSIGYLLEFALVAMVLLNGTSLTQTLAR